MNVAESGSVVEALLAGGTLAAFWGQVDTLQRFGVGVKKDLRATEELKTHLEDAKVRNQKNRTELISLKSELSDKTALLAQSNRAKSALLTSTKNKEAEYKKILAQKVAKRNAFEQELLRFESELRFAVDPSRLPSAGSGVLSWPLSAVKITQEFGNTAFAKSGAYNGNGHAMAKPQRVRSAAPCF
jgi:hypothetical protein